MSISSIFIAVVNNSSFVGDINGFQASQKAVRAMTYHNQGLNFPPEDITGFP
jgi:hypothetical protein